MANATNKMTHSKALAYALTMELPADVKADLEKLKASIDKKNTTTTDNGDKVDKNAYYKVIALAQADNGVSGTCTDWIKSVAEFNDFSTSKMSRILNDLHNDGKLCKDTVKGKSIFSKVVNNLSVTVDLEEEVEEVVE